MNQNSKLMEKLDMIKLKSIQNILKYSYGILLIGAGVDNYLNIIVNWASYLNPTITDFFATDAKTIMYYVGIIEMFAGALVMLLPKAGGYFSAILFFGIAINLVLQGKFFDVALRDTMMAIGAICLSLLSGLVEEDTTEKAVSKTGVEELEMVE